MIDFRNIRGEGAGQRDAFEELVCQIARRENPADAVEFQRLHGAGGDGGVEALWLYADGSEWGYQAKYYTRSADIDWNAIDKSVTAALKAHPKLTRYCIAVACDPTGKVPGRPGKSGWEHWAEHKKQWEAAAKNAGMTVSFEAWSASTLDGLLNQPQMTGLREYWFNTLDLSPAWLAKHFDRTVAALEERYHPEDHVEVSAREIFDGLRRSALWRALLLELHTAVTERSAIIMRSADASNASVAAVGALEKGFGPFVDLPATVPAAHDPFPLEEWRKQCKELDALAYAAERSLHGDIDAAVEAARKAKEAANAQHPAENAEEREGAARSQAIQGRPGDDIYPAILEISKIRNAIHGLQDHLDRISMLGDQSRFALIEGRAGSGKSHLLAAEVSRALADGTPCLFMIGTQIASSAPIEQQILSHFDIVGHGFDALLGALSAAAERAGQRGLVVIDAINEGAGLALWKPGLAAFVASVLRYPNLALCLSCRSEYRPALVPAAVLAKASKLIIEGFATEAEQEAAARVYMDRRGIVRPATPWLNPEFTNPLFLRTACLALERAGRTEFPKGLRGTKELLRFFLETTANALGSVHDGTGLLVKPVVDSLLAIARDMASQKRDYLSYGSAAAIIDAQFGGLTPPAEGGSWLYTLKHNGLLRLDPDPASDPEDPLAVPQDVVRFSFQRFQDHLMAEAILARITDPALIFEDEGLKFILGRSHIAWEWTGLFGALSSQVPEKYGRELVDLLPGELADWWQGWSVQQAFVESVRWRSVNAFSDRSLELLNRIDQHGSGITGLLVELSLIPSHPWNGDLLHKNLLRRTLAKRDHFWTINVNEAFGEDGHPAHRLIEWSHGTGPSRADDEVIRLALQTLAWLCTSTARPIRDGATKAMTALHLAHPARFPELAAAFAGVDDAYVGERIFASAYGACCLDPDGGRLRDYSAAVFNQVFAQPSVVPHILLRDYARGIVEIAASRGHLGAGVQLAKCRPPYGSARPALRADRDKVTARAESIGATGIISSCYRGIADFGRYTMEPVVHAFSNARLSGSPPVRAEALYKRCKDDLVGDRDHIARAFRLVEKVYKRQIPTLDPDTMSLVVLPPDPKLVKSAERVLRAGLTTEEYRRYRRECLPKLEGRGRSDQWPKLDGGRAAQIDAQKAKYWVANRAMSMGWTKDLFPYDGSRGEDRIRGSKVERIGKKYQWLALHELLARLADNYWMAPDDESMGQRYDTVLDTSFMRDVDPTVMPPADQFDAVVDSIVLLPRIEVPSLMSAELQAWIDDPDHPKAALRRALCEDSGSTKWVALYRYEAKDIDADDERTTFETPWKQTQFHFIAMHILRPDEHKRLRREAKSSSMDFHQWLPHDQTDGPFLGELGVRATWPDEMWESRQARVEGWPSFEIASPVAGYRWESHLDGSLPEGKGAHVPQPWLIDALGLTPLHPGAVYVDREGRPAVVCREGARLTHCLIRRDLLLAYLEAKDLRCLWTVVGERMAWWDGDTVRGKRIRHNGMLWLEGTRVRTESWHNFD